MKRSSTLKRTRMRRVSLSQRDFLRAWEALREQILRRDRYLCRHCGSPAYSDSQTIPFEEWGLRVCPLPGPLEVHHVVKRSHDKTRRLDEANLVTLCRPCHNWTDAGFASLRGRLVVVAAGGTFQFEVVKKRSKFEARGADGVGQNR